MSSIWNHSICLLLASCLLSGCDDANRSGSSPGSPSAATTAKVNAHTPVEPLARHPRVTLSNLQFGKSPGGEETFSVDWSVPALDNASQWTLIVKPTSSPNRMELLDWYSGQGGTISGQTISFGPSGNGPALQSGCEVYLVSAEGDLEFKISNSLTTGSASVTEPRSATEEELAKLEADLKAAPPVAGGFVPIPAGVILPAETPIKSQAGKSWVDATVISHDPVSGTIKAFRPDAKISTIGQPEDFMIDPELLKTLQDESPQP